jgi:hypothetical protein
MLVLKNFILAAFAFNKMRLCLYLLYNLARELQLVQRATVSA